MDKKQYLVAGLGNFGSSMAITLEELGCDVICIDSKEDIVQRFSKQLTYVVCGNAADVNNLIALGAEKVDVAIIGIEDLQASLLCTLHLKDLGVKTIITKASDNTHGQILEKIGSNRVVYPERETAIRMANNLFSNSIMDYLSLSGEAVAIQLKVPASLVGKNLIESNLRNLYNVNVISIIRNKAHIVNPNAKEILQADDMIVIFGAKENVHKARKDLSGN